jgi:hypothetical protein
MKLLMAVEQRQPWIVSNEINLHLLIAAKHDDIFDDAAGRLPRNARQFKTVPVQMDGMDVITFVAGAGCCPGPGDPLALPK